MHGRSIPTSTWKMMLFVYRESGGMKAQESKRSRNAMGKGLTTEEIDPERRRIARALRLLMNKYYTTLRISFCHAPAYPSPPEL